MNSNWQALILILLLLISVSLTQIKPSIFNLTNNQISSAELKGYQSYTVPPNLSFKAVALLRNPQSIELKKTPIRNWEVLDPTANAAAIAINSLDDNFPLFHYQTYKNWPLASLTKLLTAIVVLEDIGINKKISINEEIIATEGKAGGLQAGEVYTARDLLKIMIMTSSNDAAAAFEYFYGKDAFIHTVNQKIKKIKMDKTKVYDATGLSELNTSTVSDLTKLTKYILEKWPEIFSWSRLPQSLVQPINDVNNRTIKNINPLVEDLNFLGGKTGTSDEARENLLAVISLNNSRVLVIILGTQDRFGQLERLLEWVQKAYNF